MKPLFLTIMLLVLNLGCSPDKAMLMETKFDASLRQKISSLGENDPPEMLAVMGKCSDAIDAVMRQALIDAGADVHTMLGDIFTASVSSENVFKIAALDFVTQVQLSKESKLLPK
jgi:hypothetical protein